jgi:RPE4 domain-containing protein
VSSCGLTAGSKRPSLRSMDTAVKPQDDTASPLDNTGKIHAFDNITLAHHAALKASQPDDRIIIFGSFYVVSAITQNLSSP